MPSINQYMPDDGPAVYYQVNFRRMIEDHLHFLREHPQTEIIEVDPHVANKHHGDLTGVLMHYDVPTHMHWVIMRLNRYCSPLRFKSDDLQLLFPPQTAINSLLKTYRANQKISAKS